VIHSFAYSTVMVLGFGTCHAHLIWFALFIGKVEIVITWSKYGNLNLIWFEESKNSLINVQVGVSASILVNFKSSASFVGAAFVQGASWACPDFAIRVRPQTHVVISQ